MARRKAHTRTRLGAIFSGLLIVALTFLLPLEAGAQTDSDPNAATVIGRTTINADPDRPVEGMLVDVFTDNRVEYIETLTTGADGTFTYVTPASPGEPRQCRVFTFIAPGNSVFTNGSRYIDRRACTGAGETDSLGSVNVADDAIGIPARIRVLATSDYQTVQGNVIADIFTVNADGSRASFLESERLHPTRASHFSVEAGCYAVVFTAPEQPGSDEAVFPNGTRWEQQSVCVVSSQVERVETYVRLASEAGAISGTVSDEVGGASDVAIDLYRDDNQQFLMGTTTDDQGRYDFAVSDGCYRLTFTGPEGAIFEDSSSRWLNVSEVCVSGSGDVSVDATLQR